MWDTDTQNIPSGCLYRLLRDQAPLSFRELFRLLESDDDFITWYSKLLAHSKFSAFYWEHPPLTTQRLDEDAEFVLIEAALLASLPTDPAPFQSQFKMQPDADVCVFPNLGGDAMLVVPSPIGSSEAYPHLAAFVRHAPAGQVHSLWRRTSQIVREQLTSVPRWLSTAGLGVAWLHIRLDSRPKYYSYAPYKDRQGPF